MTRRTNRGPNLEGLGNRRLRIAGAETRYYILRGPAHEVVETDMMTWAHWFSDFDNRRVAETFIGDFRVSTVFLGLDHNYGDRGLPIVFETMVFGPGGDDQLRYASWDEAQTGHDAVVSRLTRERAKSH